MILPYYYISFFYSIIIDDFFYSKEYIRSFLNVKQKTANLKACGFLLCNPYFTPRTLRKRNPVVVIMPNSEIPSITKT